VALIGYDLARGPVNHPQSIDGLRSSKHDLDPWARWTITEQLAAHHVLVLHVETRHVDQAEAIALEIVKDATARERYAEILIYFHRPGRPEPLAPRRVQWTPAGGFVETVYGP
jgi:hypothetical protein